MIWCTYIYIIYIYIFIFIYIMYIFKIIYNNVLYITTNYHLHSPANQILTIWCMGVSENAKVTFEGMMIDRSIYGYPIFRQTSSIPLVNDSMYFYIRKACDCLVLGVLDKKLGSRFSIVADWNQWLRIGRGCCSWPSHFHQEPLRYTVRILTSIFFGA